MPDATITSTASTFGTISGTFAADQSTISGTVYAITGTVNGSVGVPGPQGPTGSQGPQGPQGDPGPAGVGVPSGGTTGQFLAKTSGADYATGWTTLSLAGYATESWVTAGFYPLTGNPSGFLTSSALTPYLQKAGGTITGDIQSSNNSAYRSWDGAYNTTVLKGDYLQLTNSDIGGNSLTIEWNGITFPSGKQTVHYPGTSILSGYATESWVTAGFYPLASNPAGYLTSASIAGLAPLNSPVFTGDPQAPTAPLADNDTSLATTAFVQQELASGVAVAKNLEVYVRNQTGSTLTAGTIVYINGATGNRPTVTKAQANNDANSAQTFGFVKTSIANNGFGYVIVRGECENLDTQGLTEGAQLYLSPTTAGTWTTTKPSAPQHLVYVGIVVRAHPTQGVILVAIQNGYELNEIHDVLIDTPSNGQVLKYDAAQGLWINGTDSSGVAWGGITGTLSSQTDLNTALGLKYDASNPSGFIDAAYLTTNNYATQSWVTGQNYITAAALSPYAPLSGASFSGLIVTAASSTSVAGFKLTLGSTPTSPVNGSMWGTSSNVYFRINDISETFAFQSWVTSQLGSYLTSATAASTYQTQAGMSSYLTTATAASTYQTQAGMSSYLTTSAAATTYAPISSPALSGVPTAPTASVGTNTTQIATTAFVLANASPTYATAAQSRAATSTTTSMNPSVAAWQLMYPGTVDIARGSLTYTATGTMGGTGTGFLVSRMTLGTAGACSANFRTFGGSQIDQTYGLWSKGYRSYIDFSKFIWCSGRFYTEDNINDPNVTVAFYCGKGQNSANGDLARAGFGWKFSGNATAGNRLFVVCAHNGTTLTTVTSSFAIVAQQYVDWDIISNGSGTVTLYINGTQVATTTGGPTADTSYSGTAPVIWNEEMLTTGTSAGFNATFGRGRIYMAP